jgi:alpha-tubulin suppressor-like RCC1 family protein
MDSRFSRRTKVMLLSSLALIAAAPTACGDESSDAGATDAGSDGTAAGDGSVAADGSVSDSGGGSDAALDAPEPTIVVRGNGKFTCASHNGTLRCWGANDYGQLGAGGAAATGPHSTPTPVIGMTNVGGVFALGYRHACALNGTTLSCWGANQFGELGHAPALDLDAGDDGGPSMCAAVTCRTAPAAVNGMSGITQLALGDNHSCVVTAAGAVTCWGDNSYGELGSDASGGTSTPTPVGGLANVVALGLGSSSSCALLQNGTVWCWGGNQEGALGVDTVDAGPDASGTDSAYHVAPMQVGGVVGATHLAVGVRHACAIVAGGAVMCWGRNSNGELGHASTLDPTCKLAAPCRTTAKTVAGLNGVKELALANLHSCALAADETVWCWGYNGTGELGRGDAAPTFNDPVPQKVAGLTGVAHITSGYNHACAVKHDDSTYCWGANQQGQIGSNPNDGGPTGGPLFQTPYPQRVNGL